jgi:hydroxymethylpyrimidine pyrophosphatase-like HAD family hydrolase
MSTGDVIYQHLLPVETIRELVKLALPFGVKIYTDEEVNSDDYKILPPITDPAQVKSETAKLFIDTVETKDVIPLLNELGAVKGASAHATTSWNDGDVLDIHVVHEHATKRYGVERLIKMLGHTKEETMAIGDGHNDIPLLEAAGCKVAMGNAPDEVKAVADYVTTSLEEDGVAKAIQKFILA